MNVNKVVVDNETLIDLTEDTVTADNLLQGNTAHDKSGRVITGTCTYDADTSDATVESHEILQDKTAYARGQKVVGAMPDQGAVLGTIDNKNTSYNVPLGYHNGAGTVIIDPTEAAKLSPENIRDGVQILGVTGQHIGDRNYVHVQAVASNVWTVNHNLEKYPAVTVVDSADSVVVGDIQYIDVNSLVITFTAPFSGKAFCN